MRVRRLFSVGGWLAAAALVVLAGRSLAYGLAPSAVERLELHRAVGGPRFLVVALAALGACGALAAAVLWLASTGVRERARLQPTRLPARLGARRIVAHMLGLALASCAGFAVLESSLHARAGLGWHALACLTGPIHVNALPILIGLSALAAAVVEAARHVLAWMRRAVSLLMRGAIAGAEPWGLVALPGEKGLARLAQRTTRARAPPLLTG